MRWRGQQRGCEQCVCALVEWRARAGETVHAHLFRRIFRHQPLLRRHGQTLATSFASSAGYFFEAHKAHLGAIDHS